MSRTTKKSHLRAIKRRLDCIKENIEGVCYWRRKGEIGVIDLEKEDIKKHFSIIKKHLDYLSDKF